MTKSSSIYLILLLPLFFSACNNGKNNNPDLKPNIAVPTTYEFARDGSSTVSFTGQTDRLNMLSEMKDYLKKGDNGETLDEKVLLNMFGNKSSPFGDAELNASSEQIKSKTFAPDLDSKFYENLFSAAATASQADKKATKGQAGLIARASPSKTILVDENGREFTQLIEKCLMGSLIFNQIFNVYLTESRIGNEVENTQLREGKNYTDMEHHWDESFGYFGVPVDFPTTTTDRFWGNYCDGRNELLNTNKTIMNAYLIGRTAIVNKTYDIKDEQKDILYTSLELVAAATAIHYINDTRKALSNGEQGEAFHVLSEAYAFVRSLQFSPVKKITTAQINTILNSDFGINFWDTSLVGLDNAKATLVSIYTDLASVQDQL